MKQGRVKGIGWNGRNTALIDSVIQKYYPEYGSDYVAKKVGESKEYIQSRAWHLKIRRTKKRKSKLKTKTKNQIIQELQERNHTLREQNIKLIAKNRQLKKMIILPTGGTTQ